jgi:hypothetical protein
MHMPDKYSAFLSAKPRHVEFENSITATAVAKLFATNISNTTAFTTNKKKIQRSARCMRLIAC